MEFELGKWGDGTIRLVYWDSEHGEDIIILLGDNGLAHICEDDENGREVRKQIDLVAKLREMVI